MPEHTILTNVTLSAAISHSVVFPVLLYLCLDPPINLWTFCRGALLMLEIH